VTGAADEVANKPAAPHFVIHDNSGYEHHVTTNVQLKWGEVHSGSAHLYSCVVHKGALKSSYGFSGMASFSMAVRGDRLVIRFTLPNHSETYEGEIEIQPDWRKYEPYLCVQRLDSYTATMPISEVKWPVIRVE
jgi:hypothetical protein